MHGIERIRRIVYGWWQAQTICFLGYYLFGCVAVFLRTAFLEFLNCAPQLQGWSQKTTVGSSFPSPWRQESFISIRASDQEHRRACHIIIHPASQWGTGQARQLQTCSGGGWQQSILKLDTQRLIWERRLNKTNKSKKMQFYTVTFRSSCLKGHLGSWFLATDRMKPL